jgi:hypothetical protein
MYIGIEDLVANALIELLENSEKKEVLFSTLQVYGATVIKILLENGKNAILILSDEHTTEFLRDYTDLFELFNNGKEDGIRLKSSVTVDELWRKFRSYLSLDVIKAFCDTRSVKTLGVEKS